MKFYDAHSHLHFDENREALAEFTANKNLAACACAVDLDDCQKLKRCAETLKNKLFCAYGIHPWNVDRVQSFPEAELKKYISESGIMGETGLDKNAKSDYNLQLKFFERHLRLASGLNCAVVLHCVNAWGDLLAMIKNAGLKNKILIHGAKCSPEIMRELLHFNTVFSFGMRELETPKGAACALALPSDKILTETDSAASERNLISVLQKLSELRNEDISALAASIEHNFLEFFTNGKR